MCVCQCECVCGKEREFVRERERERERERDKKLRGKKFLEQKNQQFFLVVNEDNRGRIHKAFSANSQ